MCGQAVPQVLLTVQQVLDAQLGHPEHLQQHGVCRLPTVGALLPVQVAEGDTGDVLLERGHVHLPGHPLHVHGAEATPVHAGPAGLEVEAGDVGRAGEPWDRAQHPYGPMHGLEMPVEKGWEGEGMC